MIPLIEWYRRHPEEGTFLLEVSMGAMAGQLVNIDPATGATSMMYHASPHMRAFDPHSGDYGLGFFGNALETGAYYVVDAALGPLCFLCDATPQEGGGGGGGGVAIEPLDAYRIAAYLEPLGLYLQSECGRFSRLVYDGRQSVQVPSSPLSSSDLGACRRISPHLASSRLISPRLAAGRVRRG